MADDRVLGQLPDVMRERAAALEPYAPPAAVAFREAADLVERAMRDSAGEAMNLRQAARVSGYSADHLSRLIAQGKLRNVGRKHAPLVLRGELPVKPRPVPPAAPLRMAAGAESGPLPDPDMLTRARRARRAR